MKGKKVEFRSRVEVNLAGRIYFRSSAIAWSVYIYRQTSRRKYEGTLVAWVNVTKWSALLVIDV